MSSSTTKGYPRMFCPAKFRSIPWVPITRLFYLTCLGYGALRVSGISIGGLAAILIPLCPVLLHLSLVTPRRHGIASAHPYILGWVYGLPVMAVAIPCLLLGFSPAMGGHFGWAVGFFAYESFLAAPAAAQAAMALACFALAYIPVAQFARALRADGWSVAGSRPLTTLFVIVCVPLSMGVGVTFLSAALDLPSVVPSLARLASESILRAASWSANFIAVVFFPFAALWLGFHSVREFIRQPVGPAPTMASAEEQG